ncbi:MAG: pirin family protein [Chlamydiales bacterium]|nr:pirin family protein [Chlamydiales bacterium]
MDYTIRKALERAYLDHGWLKTYHTFSFGAYHDPNFMGFGPLRVINEDKVAAESGFPTHSHRDMEIITYVIEGELAHKDSLGTVSVLKTNEFQLMHAGTGIAHSEYNPSPTTPVHFLQIWIMPDHAGAATGYQQVLPDDLKANEWNVIAGKNGMLKINQDAKISLAELDAGKNLTLTIEEIGYLQVVTGSLTMGNDTLEAGDGVRFTAPAHYELTSTTPCKLMFFNLKK